MSDTELITIGRDKHVEAMPREGRARQSGKAWSQPALWASSPGQEFAPAAVPGQYPRGFVAWALRVLGVMRSEVLHVCSGAQGPDVGGVRVDIRPDARPCVRADGRALPFAAGAFRAVLLDPPYAVDFARDLYGTEYPRPSHLLAEASRVTVPGGAIGFLHFLVPMPPPNCTMERVYGVTTGAGYRIRAWSVFRRIGPGLFDNLEDTPT